MSRAEEVHHMKPIAEGGTHVFANLKALCSFHHKQHEAEYQRGEGGRFKARWT